ncbi:MAG: T9SS type A sorting domain-containing protein [Cyclobacteriaceae bacterium]|nr:T9SS type A sorting domain-containing protein [Cyclobacteriaceae bacterium]
MISCKRRPVVFMICLAACAMLFMHIPSFSQLKKYPVQRKAIDPSDRSNKAARTQSLPAMSLPFWDDFSFPSGDVPQDTLWENSRSVWVNSNIAINTPTINAATFDGLDSLGLPFAEIQSVGFTDKLISRPIKLGTAEVPLALRSTVYLSFHYQWQGNGEPPDAGDYLQLDFKNDLGLWEEILRIATKSSFDKTVFYDTILLITGAQFFHDQFQFRFRRFGRQSGPFDTWNLDYVYLNKLRNSVDFAYPDAALASPLTTFFNEYRSVPVKHFLESKQLSKPKFDVQNLRSISSSYAYRARDTISNIFENPPPDVFSSILVNSRGIKENSDGTSSGFMAAKERTTTTLYRVPDGTDPAQFNPAAKEIQTKIFVRLASNDVYDTLGNQAPDYDPAKYFPVDFRLNDTLSYTYIMKDYYAYDDGTAEYSAGLTQSGNRALYAFNMLTPEPDTLVGFDMYFPDFSIVNNQTIDLIVYGPDPTDETKPGNNPLATINRTVTRQGINTFFSTSIIPALLVKDRFFIGWVQPSIGTPKIGLDYSNNTGDKIWVNTNGSWLNNPDDIQGTLMIRARFGKGEVITGLPEEQHALLIYPNPNRGEFFVQGEYDALNILNTTGQTVPYAEQPEGHRTRITFLSAPGLYLVNWRKGTIGGTKKIVVIR